MQPRKGWQHISLHKARSLLPKLYDAITLAAETKAAIIGVTKLWLDKSDEDSGIELPGFIQSSVMTASRTEMLFVLISEATLR